MEKRRKGYSSIDKQIEANKRYLEKNPSAKLKQKIAILKSNAKNFIKNYAEKKDIEEFRALLDEREKEV